MMLIEREDREDLMAPNDDPHALVALPDPSHAAFRSMDWVREIIEHLLQSRCWLQFRAAGTPVSRCGSPNPIALE